MSDTWHVYPVNDLIEHDTDTDSCVCIPDQRPVKHDDGSIEWIAVHHSLDGREAHERRTNALTAAATTGHPSPP